jgi:hypothetical protein
MCTSNHGVCFCTAAARPCRPCGSRMLKDCHGLASMARAGMALAPPTRQKGGPSGLECSPPGALEGLAGSPQVLLTGPTEPWPRKKTYARPLTDLALYQALPAVPCHRAERGRGCGARLGRLVLLPGACGHARAVSGGCPPRLPGPACRPPWGQPAAALCRRGQPLLTSLAQEVVSSTGGTPIRRSSTLVTKSDTDGEVILAENSQSATQLVERALKRESVF